MERLLNCSLLEKLYEDRNEDLSHKIIKKSPEYKQALKESEDKLKELLNYVPGELYKQLEGEIEDFLYEHVMLLSNFWNSNFYKIGFIDGMNVKKDIEKGLEELNDGKSDE